MSLDMWGLSLGGLVAVEYMRLGVKEDSLEFSFSTKEQDLNRWPFGNLIGCFVGTSNIMYTHSFMNETTFLPTQCIHESTSTQSFLSLLCEA